MNLKSIFSIFGRGVRVRMAPSPTGYLHIGTARATLFNYLFARKNRGTFLLRMEDTDKERSKKEYEDEMLESLKWLGLSWDEFYRQSERTDIYRRALKSLVDSGRAYLSKEASKNEPGKEVEVVRLRNPGRTITFVDGIRGPITFDTKELGDFVIARAIDDPLYHLAVVVDDAASGITHVIRSEDHISNTPRQILIQEALGVPRPLYFHQPLVLAPDRSKMSKRHGATSVRDYRAQGFIPEALVNFLALLGWNPGTEQELFTLAELVEAFDLSGLQKHNAVFDLERLKWFNREHLKRLSDKDFLARLQGLGVTGEKAAALVPLLKERASTLKEAYELIASPEFAFVKGVPSYDSSSLIPSLKDRPVERAEIIEHLTYVHERFQAIAPSSFSAAATKDAIFAYATEKGRGAVLWPLRYALSGSPKSPDPFTIAEILGKEETERRLAAAIEKL